MKNENSDTNYNPPGNFRLVIATTLPHTTQTCRYLVSLHIFGQSRRQNCDETARNLGETRCKTNRQTASNLCSPVPQKDDPAPDDLDSRVYHFTYRNPEIFVDQLQQLMLFKTPIYINIPPVKQMQFSGLFVKRDHSWARKVKNYKKKYIEKP